MKKTTTWVIGFAVLSVSIFLGAPVTLGQSVWNVSGGGDFADGANWDTPAAPDNVNATFNNSASGTITMSDSNYPSIRDLYFTNNHGVDDELVFDFGSNSLTSTGRLGFSGSNANNVRFTSGTFSFSTFVSFADNGAHTVEISGTNTNLTTGRHMVSTATSPSITVKDGATVSIGRLDSALGGSDNAVSGGTSFVVNNATMTFGGRTFIGSSGGTGASLTIENGGKVTTTFAGGDPELRAGNAGAIETTVTVTGAGSELNVGGALSSRGTDGLLTISNGATVTAGGGLNIGAAVDAKDNTVVITGSTTTVTSGHTAYIGFSEGARGSLLRIEDGATFTTTGVGSGLRVGWDDAPGELRLDGGTVSTTQGVWLGYAGDTASDNRIVGRGTIDADVSVFTDGSGQVQVGLADELGNHQYGILNATQDWDNTSIGITLKLGDFSEGATTAGVNFDQLLIGGEATAGGSLTINLDDYIGNTGTTEVKLLLMGWDSVTGEEGDLTVNFSEDIEEDPTIVGYSFESDGLYMTVMIPEPGTLGLMLMTAGLMAVRRWKRVPAEG